MLNNRWENSIPCSRRNSTYGDIRFHKQIMERYFSKKIKTVRVKLGYSQFDFAKLLQMSQIELHKIETGQINPRVEVLTKFAEMAFYEIISPFRKKEKEPEEPKPLFTIVPDDEDVDEIEN